LTRLGLSYEEVSAIRPDIIYAHASGFGSDGPYAGLPAYDDLIQAASGMADLIPRTFGGEPALLPTQAADKVSGLFLAQALGLLPQVVDRLFRRRGLCAGDGGRQGNEGERGNDGGGLRQAHGGRIICGSGSWVSGTLLRRRE
jgi:hypothetical protein